MHLNVALNQDSVAGLVLLDLTVLRIAVFFIMIGAILIAFRFIPHMGFNKSLFFVLFHAVTVFGNAGFDLLGVINSLTGTQSDYLVISIKMVLFLFGRLRRVEPVLNYYRLTIRFMEV